jgi:hypothetical protein
MNDLLRGQVSRFSLDALVNISTALGCRVRVNLKAARERRLTGHPRRDPARRRRVNYRHAIKQRA